MRFWIWGSDLLVCIRASRTPTTRKYAAPGGWAFSGMRNGYPSTLIASFTLENSNYDLNLISDHAN
jgi:hypothetical protein